jgi:ATP-dependent helicase/nuclease subunit A
LNNSISGSEDEAQATIDIRKTGVNLLTIHQAKSLEFPAVFLYKCDDTTPPNKVKARSITIDKNFGLLTKVPINDDFFGTFHSAPTVGIYNFVEGKKEYAELKRLLYVGLTRAKDFLFISQTGRGESYKRNSFSGLILEGLNVDFKKNYLNLDGELTFLKTKENNYSNISQKLNFKILITSDVQIEQEIAEKSSTDIVEKEFLMPEISDHSKGEVISATRFAVYSNCPMKYNLMYNYKLGELFSHSTDFTVQKLPKEESEYNRNESASYLFDDKSGISELMKLKGKIVHLALQKNIKIANVKHFIEERIKNISDEVNKSSFIESVTNNISKFYDSDEFKYLDSFKSFKNEYEIYLKKSDYYLFGIIDKIIFDEQKLIIVDYKTDNIVNTQITTSGTKYLPQLKFYSYIVQRLFDKKSEIEGRVMFIKHPENPFIFTYNDVDDRNINSNLNRMIQSLRNNEYSLNLNHCKECLFADENLVCIKSRVENIK